MPSANRLGVAGARAADHGGGPGRGLPRRAAGRRCAFGLEAACDASRCRAGAGRDAARRRCCSLRRLQEAAAHDLLGAAAQPLEQALASAAARHRRAGDGEPRPARRHCRRDCRRKRARLPRRRRAWPPRRRGAAGRACRRRCGDGRAGLGGGGGDLRARRAAGRDRGGFSPGAFGPRAKAVLAEDVGTSQMRLAAQRLAGGAPEAGGGRRLSRRWCRKPSRHATSPR